MDRRPWDVHPELIEERLITIAEILRDVRHEALPFHEPDKGDSNWGLGTRVSERTWYAISEAEDKYPWLSIINPSRHFVFSIGGVPFRFYRGLPEKPNARILARQYPEILKHQLAFEFYKNDSEYFWRIAVETDILGAVMRIVVAQMSEQGDIKMRWVVPMSRNISALGAVSHTKPQGVELPPPAVTGKKRGKLQLVKSQE